MSNYQISKTEIEDITGGLSIEDLIESIDRHLLFILFNAHQLDLRNTKDDIWGIYMARAVLCRIREDVKE